MSKTVKVYWQPGCSSCLKTKEFLETNNVKFESINILEDPRGFKDLENRHNKNSETIQDLKTSVSKITNTSQKIQNLDLENKKTGEQK